MKIPETLVPFLVSLNSFEVLPDKAYRRENHLFPLVCHVNNLLGACLSENREVLPALSKRTAEHMVSFPSLSIEREYYSLVERFLAAVAEYLGHGT